MKKDELTPKDRGLRRALRHRTEAAERITPSADFTDRLMQRIPQPEKTPVRRRLWLYPAAAVAAGVLLLVTLHFKYNKEETVKPASPIVLAEKEDGQNAMVMTEEKSLMVESSNAAMTDCRDIGRRVHDVQQIISSEENKPQPVNPDTLGDEIWSQREHVLLALRMLVECESACEQRRGNALIEAAFHASEHPDQLLLVVSENGDYMIVDENQKAPVLVL